MGIFDVAFAKDLVAAVFGFWSTVLSQYIFQYSLSITILTFFVENRVLPLLKRIRTELVMLDLFPKREMRVGEGGQFLLCAFILGIMLPIVSVFLSMLYFTILHVLLDVLPMYMNAFCVFITTLSFPHVGWWGAKAMCPPCFVVVSRKVSSALIRIRM